MFLRELFATRKEVIYNILHLIILGLSIFLVVSISIDTFDNKEVFTQRRFMREQFWICIVFLADYFIEFFMAERKMHYFLTRMTFLLVSIPYLNIIHHYGWSFSPEVTYLLRFIPLIRGGYALAIVVGWFTSNKAASLVLTYLLVLVASVYFGAMVFYSVEHSVNPGVENFYNALWWAAMDTTTTGSNITAMTPIGQVLSVILSCLGVMMLPLFTVYVTTLIQKRNDLFLAQKQALAKAGKAVDTPSDEKE
nr:two pore domain potassium channel family protein [Bacteroides sp.]